MAFILENVDSMDTGDDDTESSNVQVALGLLKEIGYHAVVEKLNSADYGVPQRRCRLYFVGLRDSLALAESKEDILAKLHGRLIRMMTPAEERLSVASQLQVASCKSEH
ncbi:ngoBIM [Symbiodinium sp. CCMP2592]|nr:ngoBIM [Symbiodinium sp. CCMP2592]